MLRIKIVTLDYTNVNRKNSSRETSVKRFGVILPLFYILSQHLSLVKLKYWGKCTFILFLITYLFLSYSVPSSDKGFKIEQR
jgi:uncharacterized membrane protein YjfL (UPF0719 family)